MLGIPNINIWIMRIQIKITFTVILVVSVIFNSLSQQRRFTTENRRALSSYEMAIEAYHKYDYGNAIMHLQNAIKQDGRFVEAHLLLSQIYHQNNQLELAIVSAEEAIRINPEFFPNIYIQLGDIHIKRGEYQRAYNHLKTFIGFTNVRPDPKKLAERYILNCEFALHALENPVPFTPINLGPNVNTNLDEYWPSLSADENTLVITVNVPKDPTMSEIMYNRQEDFYITTRGPDGEWQPIRSIGPPINTPHFNEGAQSLTADGQRMYYTVCPRRLCDLYFSDRQPNGRWGNPQKLPMPVNTPSSSEKQPSISPDGKTLYFVSNRNGGLGNFDIWRSHRLDDNRWSQPENLGETINTPYNEQSPFIHFDNQTLYFSSDGHVGMGGLDIFMTRMINDTTWSKPVNLGYPINTHRDEDGLIVNAKGTMAYFSSDIRRESGRDIYKFEIPEEVSPIPASYISGLITDARSGWPLRANFNLVDVTSNQEIMNTNASSEGSFFLTIPTNRNYALFASHPGYLFHSMHFSLEGVHTAEEPYHLNIELNPIRVGSTMVMRNIFFETDSYELKPESIVELNKLLELLKLNPSMKIEVGGHTDNVGTAAYNLTLSENRAKSVANFLTSNGVDKTRITSKGYGLTKPIGDNNTEKGRAQNRRTEIRVTGL